MTESIHRHIVITNPHIQRVYERLYHAFQTLTPLKEIRSIEQNEEFTKILKNLLNEQSRLRASPMMELCS